MSLTGHPEDNSPPNGYLVRLVSLLGEKERCQELSYFFGKTAAKDALAHFNLNLDPEALGDLSPGKYRLTIHPAWRGSETRPNEYDETTTLGLAKFLLRRTVSLENLSREHEDLQ